ncbi:hypothetical protein CCUS01_12688 [Colletotrichum cuscutae]|uniref:Uncharacterized protein n=1 Tax=Colletotrichum cuscutae TaxID=1209917 RepID=A0AAI9XE25_9PEZI|nr:hypothetical protein CCUS01_12688 [Colletotrichum cuscutae]
MYRMKAMLFCQRCLCLVIELETKPTGWGRLFKLQSAFLFLPPPSPRLCFGERLRESFRQGVIRCSVRARAHVRWNDDGLFDVEIWLERRPMARRDDLQSPLTKKRIGISVRGNDAKWDPLPRRLTRRGKAAEATSATLAPTKVRLEGKNDRPGDNRKGSSRNIHGPHRTVRTFFCLPTPTLPTGCIRSSQVRRYCQRYIDRVLRYEMIDLPIGGEWTCVWGPALASFLLGTVQSSITKEWRNKLPITIPSSVPGAGYGCRCRDRYTTGVPYSDGVGIKNIRFPAEVGNFQHDEELGGVKTLTLQVVPTLIGTCPPIEKWGNSGQWKKEAIHLAYLSELGTYRNQELRWWASSNFLESRKPQAASRSPPLARIPSAAVLPHHRQFNVSHPSSSPSASSGSR